MTDYRVVFVTTSSEEEAVTMGRELVEQKLAGCVNIIPQIRSLYVWEGALCDEKEVLMIIKTRSEKVKELTEKVISLHSYDIPEVICLKIESGSEKYLEWLGKQTGT